VKRSGILAVLLFLGLSIEPGRADVVYPARLQIKEIRPGEFSVQFNLPIVNDRRLRAEPILPSVCEQIGEKDIRVSQIEYVEQWQFRSAPDSLFGKRIAVRGLLGTQIDVVLFLDMLDGRSYSAILKPAKAVYEVPSPPSIMELVRSFGARGMRDVVSRPELLLLFFFLVFVRIERADLFRAALGLLIGFSVGQYLSLQKWIQISSQLPAIVILVLILLPSIDLLRNRGDAAKRLQPFGIIAALVGTMLGGTSAGTLTLDRLSLFEGWIAFSIHVAGFVLGLLLGFFLMMELRRILETPRRLREFVQSGTFVGYVSGTLAVALLLFNASALLVTPSIIPEAPPEAYVLAFSIGFWLAIPGSMPNGWLRILLLVPLAGGVLLGHAGISLPAGSFFVHGTLFLAGMIIATGRMARFPFSLPVLGVAVFYHGWSASAFVEENLSLPVAVSIGAAVTALVLLQLSRSISTAAVAERLMPAQRLIGSAVALVAVMFRLGEYVQWFDGPLASDAALGYVPIPLLSLALLATAALVWPRRRKVQQLLELEMQKPLLHWALIALAFFVLPLGTVRAKNIFHEGVAPSGETARRILEQVFTNTYHAFNIEDEDELYNKLSENVAGDLVADIYLDSRRKLTSGVRQGAEVTVRDVSVLSVGTISGGSDPTEGYSYECKWSVTARVRHLQHVHHRQNIYTGVVRISVSDGRWKINKIALLSEDRVIIPWRSG